MFTQKQAQWLDISKGMFELTEWQAIAKEWFGEKPRNLEQVDAPCILRKGLPRAFPGLEELKDRSRKEGTQYCSRVFQAPLALVQGRTPYGVCVMLLIIRCSLHTEVVLHITNRSPPSHQLMYTPPTGEPYHSVST